MTVSSPSRPPLLLAGAFAASSVSAHDAPGSTNFDLLIPGDMMTGQIIFATLIGPPADSHVLHATWNLTFDSPPGGTPASDVEIEIGLTTDGVKTWWLVTGADMGWPSANGSFSGSLDSDLFNGVVDAGLFGFPTADLEMSAPNGVTGQFVSSTMTLELAGETCQTDLGFGGPGNMGIAICGEALASGQSATLDVSGAPPAGTVFLLLGTNAAAVPFKGGTLVPVPYLQLLAVQSDGNGDFSTTVPGGNGPFTFYAQAVAPDGTLPKGFAISNALEVELLP